MKRTIYSNYNLWEMEDDIREFLLEENGEEPTEDEIWEQIYFEDEINWECDFNELKHFFNNQNVIMFGTLGLWNGNFTGGKTGDFESLFYEAVKDCEYWEFTDDNGHLYLSCSHHDGTNYFEIKVLTDRGSKYINNWNYSYEEKYNYSKEEMHRRLTSCSFLSRLPHFYKKVYGI